MRLLIPGTLLLLLALALRWLLPWAATWADSLPYPHARAADPKEWTR